MKLPKEVLAHLTGWHYSEKQNREKMRIIAHQTPPVDETELREAQILVMDADAYQQMGGYVPGLANIVIGRPGTPDYFGVPDLGLALRIAMSIGCETMHVVGSTLYHTAVSAYQAEMR